MERSLCSNCTKLKREVARLRDEVEELETERTETGEDLRPTRRSSFGDGTIVRALEDSVKDLRHQLSQAQSELDEAGQAQELANIRIESMQQQLSQERARRREIEEGLEEGQQHHLTVLEAAQRELSEHQERSRAWDRERGELQEAHQRAEQAADASTGQLDGQGARVAHLEEELETARRKESQDPRSSIRHTLNPLAYGV